MEKIKEGDVVRLKSGGPAMTVNDLNGGRPECVWFVEGEIKSAYIWEASLEKLDL